jgi:N-acyl-D-aspartate/D-glutamate deacylase
MKLEVHDNTDEDKLAAITYSLIDTIRTLRDDGMSWKKITKRITKQTKARETVPYIIYHSQTCGYPLGCKELAVVVFLYSQGAVFACFEHYKETEEALHGH